ncbi:MAG: hypothetical protein ABA06_00415 [Parcubacteria bacterium C7867-001]|nr:MAG: hypothetical protein ABA06_00415 [Parcubacteria bacterium C7867-001]
MIFPVLPPADINLTNFAAQQGVIDRNRKTSESASVERSSKDSERVEVERKEITAESVVSEDQTVIEGVEFKESDKSSSSVNDQSREHFSNEGFGDAYIKHSTAAAILQIKNLIEEWNKKGTKDSTSEISQIKTTLEEYAPFFTERPESEVLLGGLETIFDGDRWERLDSAKLTLISRQLENFQAGNVRWESLRRFAREIYSAEIV